jgi:hypothetical protein
LGDCEFGINTPRSSDSTAALIPEEEAKIIRGDDDAAARLA